MKSTFHQFGRFLVVGVVNTGLSYGIFLLLLPHLHYAYAYALAFVTGILVSYVLNAIFVFRHHSLHALLGTPLVYLLQYCYGAIALAMFIDVFGLSPEISMLIVMASAALLTFGMLRGLFSSQPVGGLMRSLGNGRVTSKKN